MENKQYKTNTNMNKKLIRLTESDLHKIVKEAVNRIIKESVDEFTYSDSDDLGRGRHRQTIIYKGKEIGYLLSIEKTLLPQLKKSIYCQMLNTECSQAMEVVCLMGKKVGLILKYSVIMMKH